MKYRTFRIRESLTRNTASSIKEPTIRAPKTHCKRGHEYDRYDYSGRGNGRDCKKCRKERHAAKKIASDEARNEVSSSREKNFSAVVPEVS